MRVMIGLLSVVVSAICIAVLPFQSAPKTPDKPDIVCHKLAAALIKHYALITQAVNAPKHDPNIEKAKMTATTRAAIAQLDETGALTSYDVILQHQGYEAVISHYQQHHPIS